MRNPNWVQPAEISQQLQTVIEKLAQVEAIQRQQMQDIEIIKETLGFIPGGKNYQQTAEHFEQTAALNSEN